MTPVEYNLMIEVYMGKQKERLYRDMRNAYYTGCFAQVEKPKELYDKIIESIESKPQTGEDIFNFLKNISIRGSNPREDVSGSHFRIPLKLTPDFDVGVFSYICYMEGDSLEMHLPDVALALNHEMLKPENGMYRLKPGLLKVKYNEHVYSIVLIGR